jgi:2-oxoglutarate dehydrogenase complex dehydrogenase (E1) component-like enzyme
MIEKVSDVVAKILELQKQEKYFLALRGQLYDVLSAHFQFKFDYIADSIFEIKGKAPPFFNLFKADLEEDIDISIKFDGVKIRICDNNGRLLSEFYLDNITFEKLILLAEWENRLQFLTKCIETVKDMNKKAEEKLRKFKEVLAAVKLMLK